MLATTHARLRALFPSLCIEGHPALRRDRHGFAKVSLWHRGRQITLPAHRVAYSLFVADIQSGQPVRHACGNPACINPLHLVGDTAVPPAPSSREVDPEIESVIADLESTLKQLDSHIAELGEDFPLGGSDDNGEVRHGH